MVTTYDVIIQIASFVLGTLISFVMSWYFYKKSDFPAKVTSSMAEDVLLLLVQSKIGVDFDYEAIVPKSDLPRNLSTPHILRYWLSRSKVRPGDDLHLLFRVQDTDFDFPGAENIEITEMESDVSFRAKRQGHGYYSAQVTCPLRATPGIHTLVLKLKDSKGNAHQHQIKFEVIP